MVLCTLSHGSVSSPLPLLQSPPLSTCQSQGPHSSSYPNYDFQPVWAGHGRGWLGRMASWDTPLLLVTYLCQRSRNHITDGRLLINPGGLSMVLCQPLASTIFCSKVHFTVIQRLSCLVSLSPVTINQMLPSFLFNLKFFPRSF